MDNADLTVYATSWCGDCRRTRAFLTRHQIAYAWIDIDQDKGAEALVRQWNNGYRSVPTLVFPDGSRLVEPSDAALAEKLGLKV
jgi:glutaredoxin-like protein